MSLLTLVLINLIPIILIFIAHFSRNEYIKATFYIIGGILIIITLTSSLVFSLKNNNTKIIQPITPKEIVISKTKIYVDFGNKTEIYSSKEDYDLINDSTYFYKITYYNLYGSINYIEYKYSITLLDEKYLNIETINVE